MGQHDAVDAGDLGDPADHRRRHVELSRGAGFTFGNRVVRYEQISPCRQSLEITVITIGVAALPPMVTRQAIAGRAPWMTCVAANKRSPPLTTVRISRAVKATSCACSA